MNGSMFCMNKSFDTRRMAGVAFLPQKRYNGTKEAVV